MNKEDVIGNLSPRDQLLYEMLESGEYTQQEVAAKFNITHQRVHQVYKSIKLRIKAASQLQDNSIAELYLSTGAYNALKRAEIYTILDLTKCIKNGQLHNIRGLGPAYKNEIYEALKNFAHIDDSDYDNLHNSYKITIKYIQNFGATIQFENHIKKWIKCYCVDTATNQYKRAHIPFIIEITDKDNYHIYKSNKLPLSDEKIIEIVKKLLNKK